MHLPRVLPKFCVTLVVFLSRIVDSSSHAMSVPLPTLSVRTELTDNSIELLGLLSHVPDRAGGSKFVEVERWRGERTGRR